MAKNINIIAEGIAGDNEGRVLGYNDTNFGYKAPIIGTIERDSEKRVVGKDEILKVVPPNTLAVDYTNGVAEMLLEPASTNLVQYSEDFSQGYWSKIGSTITSGQQSPDGGNNAYKIDLGGVDADNRFALTNFNVDSEATYTVSYFVKNIDSTNFKIRISGSIDIAIDEVVPITNEWLRFSKTFTTSASATTIAIQFGTQLGATPTLGSYYLFGIQLEELSYPTSYIPNNGNSAGATRQADSLTDFGFEQVIDSESGILFFEGSTLVNEQVSNQLSISDGSSSNRVFINFGSNTNNVFGGYSVGSVNQAGISLTGVDKTINFKLAYRYAENNFSLWYNGVKVDEDLDGSVLSSGFFNKLSFTQGTNLSFFYGRIRQVKHLPFNTDILSL